MNLHDEFMFCNQQVISTVYILSLLIFGKGGCYCFLFFFFKPGVILFFFLCLAISSSLSASSRRFHWGSCVFLKSFYKKIK